MLSYKENHQRSRTSRHVEIRNGWILNSVRRFPAEFFSWTIFNKSYKTEAEQAADLLKLIENMSNQNPAIIQMLTQALSQQQFTSSTSSSRTADLEDRTTNQSDLNVKR